MNLHPIEHAALAAAQPSRAQIVADRETLITQAAALARQVVDVMLANVQNTASLNLTAARALLAHAHIPTPVHWQPRSDTWRHTWRSFEICATSADQVLQLTRGHVDRTTTALWGTTERLLDEMQQADHARSVALRDAFAAMRSAQTAYWQATQQVHEQLVATVQAPLPRSSTEPRHGTH